MIHFEEAAKRNNFFLSVLCVLCVYFSVQKVYAIVDPNTIKKVEPAFVEASSVLKASLSKDPNQFAADKAIDGKWETAWAEGGEGPGVGEWLRLVFVEPTVVNHLALIPGWAKNRVRFKNNPRLKRAIISFNTGPTQDADFEDIMSLQFITLHYNKPVKWIQITVAETYKGRKFEDLSISEVELYADIK